MAATDATDGVQDLEAPEEEVDDEMKNLLHFGNYYERRHALPREQWTFKEKANFYIDRIFLGVLVIFLLMLVGEFGFKMLYVINVKKVVAFMSESGVFVFDWLFAQQRQEELYEL